VSRKNVEYKRYRGLERDISAAFSGHEAVLDGEIVTGPNVPRPAIFGFVKLLSEPEE
jgi:hypothetical protein